MKLGPLIALLVFLSAASAFSAEKILDSMVPDELSGNPVGDDFAAGIFAPMR